MWCQVYVVPLIEEACPRRVPCEGRAVRGGVTVVARLHWVKPWLIDAQTVLDMKSVELDAWAILFKISRAQELEAVARVSGSKTAAPLFRILGGLRYRKRSDEFRVLLERMAAMMNRELFRESLAVQEWLDEGKAAGVREGFVKFLTFKFPNWPIPASLDSIRDADVLSRLFDKATVTKDKAAMARAIDKASKGLNF